MKEIRKENLRAYLKARKITQKSLAQVLKLEPPTVAESVSGLFLIFMLLKYVKH